MSYSEEARGRIANKILKQPAAERTHLFLALLIEQLAGCRDELANVAAAVDRIPDNAATEMSASLHSLAQTAERVEHDNMLTRRA